MEEEFDESLFSKDELKKYKQSCYSVQRYKF